MRNILVFYTHYLPAYKAGGPIRTIQAIVEHLGDEFLFRIVTKDRDLGDRQPFPAIGNDTWCEVGKAQVRYLAPHEYTFAKLRAILHDTPHDLLYLNSFLDPIFTIHILLLQRLKLIPRKPIIIAPRGEFSPEALRLKAVKKHIYITTAKLLHLYDDVYWQASSEQEAKDILEGFLDEQGSGETSRLMIAPDLVPVFATAQLKHAPKMPGILRVVFLSRISPMKNLDFAIDCLSNLSGIVYLDIYGPIQEISYEEAYWASCQEKLYTLPSSILWTYHGPVPPSDVQQVLTQYDLFFLPTLGENFGHAILEALNSGCPVLISDRTPWRNLAEAQAGWDIPLNQPGEFIEVLQSLVDMDEIEFSAWRNGAYQYGQCFITDKGNIERQRKLFLTALGGGS